ncbi:MAG: hypothetical protein P4N59_16160 [Negativicutes bacterium]|nr:hypothetical protein [Negativicutes bacterium]
MRNKKMLIAILISIGFHIIVPLSETIAEQHGRNVKTFDSIISWPAWFCSVVVPPGHGVPQLVFPFIFSLVFYAAIFWLLIILYERLSGRVVLHKNSIREQNGPDEWT